MSEATAETVDIDLAAYELHTRIRMVEAAADLAIESGEVVRQRYDIAFAWWRIFADALERDRQMPGARP
ncbi:hypothetical protein LB543_01225 [Mesorhizobium sp. ESP7-2]|uniref:hypothetical protein n=1 Tax=Mesorhizobium sp. ESP7-2 TaxID=2876622 RepID=UPI001CCD4133|nr:hypothetical protein [Mesorhizobium sp. ESP7-2]MBZ9705350.1 hypothetical protein [Mesorhizobium sp. ESP7-2]